MIPPPAPRADDFRPPLLPLTFAALLVGAAAGAAVMLFGRPLPAPVNAYRPPAGITLIDIGELTRLKERAALLNTALGASQTRAAAAEARAAAAEKERDRLAAAAADAARERNRHRFSDDDLEDAITGDLVAHWNDGFSAAKLFLPRADDPLKADGERVGELEILFDPRPPRRSPAERARTTPDWARAPRGLRVALDRAVADNPRALAAVGRALVKVIGQPQGGQPTYQKALAGGEAQGRLVGMFGAAGFFRGSHGLSVETEE